jgi:hypothetical protein
MQTVTDAGYGAPTAKKSPVWSQTDLQTECRDLDSSPRGGKPLFNCEGEKAVNPVLYIPFMTWYLPLGNHT